MGARDEIIAAWACQIPRSLTAGESEAVVGNKPGRIRRNLCEAAKEVHYLAPGWWWKKHPAKNPYLIDFLLNGKGSFIRLRS